MISPYFLLFPNTPVILNEPQSTVLRIDGNTVGKAGKCQALVFDRVVTETWTAQDSCNTSIKRGWIQGNRQKAGRWQWQKELEGAWGGKRASVLPVRCTHYALRGGSASSLFSSGIQDSGAWQPSSWLQLLVSWRLNSFCLCFSQRRMFLGENWFLVEEERGCRKEVSEWRWERIIGVVL